MAFLFYDFAFERFRPATIQGFGIQKVRNQVKGNKINDVRTSLEWMEGLLAENDGPGINQRYKNKRPI